MKRNVRLMKRMAKAALFVLLLSVVGLTNATAQTFTVGNLNYSLNSDGASVTVTGHVDGTAATGELVIPESIELYGVSYPVTEIGYKAFYHCTGLTGSLVIPNSVKTIGEHAFYYCNGFTGSLTIGNFVQRIKGRAFYYCGFSGSLIIPENVTEIDYDAFENCDNFTSLYYNAINVTNNLFSGSSHWLYGCNSITTLSIGENVQKIPANLLNGCSSITGELVIPESVTTIGESAFNGCSGLTGSLTIPNYVTTIGLNAFNGCSGLSGTLTIGPAVTEIGNTAFFGACENITSYVFLPETPPTLGNNAFASANFTNPASVHCGSLEAYQNADGWNVFSNIQELDPCLWMVSAKTGDMAYGGVISGSASGMYQQGQTCTFSATPNEGYRFVNWTEDGEVVSTDATYTITVTSDRDLVANFNYNYAVSIGLDHETVGGGYPLPSSTLYSYCLSLQIYTADEIGAIGEINRLAFYSNYAYTRNYDIYLIHTEKTHFVNYSDGIVVTDADKVFSGNVTFNLGAWTTITFDTPFVYNGTSNLLIVVDDNTGKTFIGGYICCSFISDFGQTLASFGSSNFDPHYAQNFVSLYSVKNKIIFGFTSPLSYNINLSVTPAEGGWVTGNGAYQEGETCTVTATANEGYVFTNWTENGEVVSTDAAYSFTVTQGRNLVANFRSMANHWTPEDSNYADNMSLSGVILIDGVEQRTEALEVGVFCGNECRGSHLASYFPPTDRYVVMLTIFGNAGDNLTFKLYDHDAEEELDLISPTSVVFDANGYGTPIVPYVLNFTSTVPITATVTPEGAGTVTGAGEYFPTNTCTLTATANSGFQFLNWTLNGEVVSTNPTYTFTVAEAANYVAHFQYAHTRALASGWNWYSTYVEQNGINGLEMLENGLGTAGVRIQARNAYVEQVEYQGNNYWYGTLNNLTNEQMYKIRTNASCNAVLVGEKALVANHPITINSGWNWIGFPMGQSVSVETAMSGFTPEPDDILKGRNTYTTYISYGNYNLWYGSLNTLEPGHGYMYKSNSTTSKTLTFQAGKGGDVVANITPEDNVFVPDGSEFSSNMVVTAVIDLDGEELRSDEYELAAFVGDECRGSAKLMYVEPFDRYVAFLMVYGEEAEDIHFVLTNGVETRWSVDELVYSSDAIVGALSQPTTIHFGVLGVNDNEPIQALVYPNPSDDMFNIQCAGIRKVEVVNALGQVVMAKEAEGDFLQIDLGNKIPGTYVVRIVTNNGTVMKKLFKK